MGRLLHTHQTGGELCLRFFTAVKAEALTRLIQM